jgi:hypothetical protein
VLGIVAQRQDKAAPVGVWAGVAGMTHHVAHQPAAAVEEWLARFGEASELRRAARAAGQAATAQRVGPCVRQRAVRRAHPVGELSRGRRRRCRRGERWRRWSGSRKCSPQGPSAASAPRP